MPNIGLNFSPTQGATQYGGQNNQTNAQGAANPVMDAIKILSFRVPSVLGANAPVGAGLLGGAGGNAGSGLDNSAMVLNWLNRFFGQGAAASHGLYNPTSPVFGGGGAPSSPPPGGIDASPGPMPSPGAPAASTPPGRPAFTFPTTVPPPPMPSPNQAPAGGYNAPSPMGGDNPTF